MFFSVEKVVRTCLQSTHDLVHNLIFGLKRLAGGGDDERASGLVDEHFVHLVDESEEGLSLHLLLGVLGGDISKVVKPQGAVGGVGDVGGVAGSLFVLFHPLQHGPHGHPEEFERRCHFGGVAGS